jgi:hypothetical protein
MPSNAAVQQCTIPGHVGSYRHPRAVLAVTEGDYSHIVLEGSAVPRAFQRDGVHEEHTVIRIGNAVPVSGVRFIAGWVLGDLVRAEKGRRGGTGCQRHQPAAPNQNLSEFIGAIIAVIGQVVLGWAGRNIALVARIGR